MLFCRSYTIHILGKHSVVTSVHSRAVYSTFCSAIFMQNEAPLPLPHQFNYKYWLICLAQCLGTADWNLIRPPPIFRRACKISKSGNAPISFVTSAFLYVCLSVYMDQLKHREIFKGTFTKNLQRRMNLVTTEQKKNFMWRPACVNDNFNR